MIFKINKLYPKQVEFCKATTKYVAYGGARGGGKSYASRIKATLLALNYSGIQILLLRRTLNELRENHVVPLLKLLKDVAIYKESTKEFIFPNSSRIKLGYCDTETDVLQYQGQSYDVIVIEEATQFTEFQFNCLTESNRLSGQCETFKQPRMYFTCNPGGVGHSWFKRLFIDKDYKETENAADYTFIKSLVYDNEFIMENDPGYVNTLENLPEDRKKAMLYGNWDVYEGQFLREFDREKHVIDPFIIPMHWNRYISLDYGLDMLAALWFAVDEQKNIYVYKELYKPNLIISDAAREIIKTNNNDNIIHKYAPPDLWNRRQETGYSAYDIFKQNGVALTKSNNNRIQGWLAVKELLKIEEKKDAYTGEVKKESTLKIFTNCTNLIRTLPLLQHDSKNPNDVANNPHELTHINDALRGFCIERTKKAEPVINIIDEFGIYTDKRQLEVTDNYLFY